MKSPQEHLNRQTAFEEGAKRSLEAMSNAVLIGAFILMSLIIIGVAVEAFAAIPLTIEQGEALRGF